jgi:hypothetical protein
VIVDLGVRVCMCVLERDRKMGRGREREGC